MRRSDRAPRARRRPRSALTLWPLAMLVAIAAGSIPLAQPASGAGGARAADDQVTHSDFNGDGYADLAIAAPSETVNGKLQAGAVHVLYGGPQGLSATGSQRFVLGSGGVPLAPEPRDFLGLALASGDFDADGDADLAVGVPRKDLGLGPLRVADEGLVLIFHGSASGLAYARTLMNQNAGDGGFCLCRFGRSLAAGDFNDDGRADLAIGTDRTRGEETVAYVLYGASEEGLRIVGRTALEEPPRSRITDWGYADLDAAALAAGDHNGDGFDDLAIGSPDSYIGRTAFDETWSAGVVAVVPGSAVGVEQETIAVYVEPTATGGSAREGDGFGASLVFGDFRGSGREQLVVGIPYDDRGSKADAGAVAVFSFKRDPGPLETLGRIWSQGDLSGARLDTGDRFGYALAAGDVTGDGRDDLAIGVPGESFSGSVRAGVVHLLKGSSTGIIASGAQSWHQDRSGIAGAAERGDQFGFALAIGKYDSGARRDLAVGVPGEKLSDKANAGALNVLLGSSTGLSSAGSQFWSQNSTGIAGAAEAGDWFGQVLR